MVTKDELKKELKTIIEELMENWKNLLIEEDIDKILKKNLDKRFYKKEDLYLLGKYIICLSAEDKLMNLTSFSKFKKEYAKLKRENVY